MNKVCNNILSTILFLLLTISCNKEKFKGMCHDLPSSPSATGWNYIYPSYNHKAPFFNPNNPEEIVYVREDFDTNDGSFLKTELWKADITAGTEELLLDNVRNHPRWGITNWLLFNRTDNQVWKMKSNGDSLTQLTNGTLHTYPDWNPDNTKFICNTFDNYTLIISQYAEVLDTLEEVYYYRGAWSPNGKYIAASIYAGGLDVNDLETGEIIRFQSEYEVFAGNGGGIAWTPDSRYLIWCTSAGIYKSDIETLSTEQIKEACESLRYTKPSISSDYELIVERVENNIDKNENTFFSKSSVTMMDLDGENERELLLK